MREHRKNWLKKKILDSSNHQEEAFKHINQLVVRKREGRKITLTDGKKLVDFLSCSYFDLDLDQRIIEASTRTIYTCGVNFAVSRTRIRTESFLVLEELLNALFCNSYTTTFTSIHLAHLGIFPLLSSGEMPSFPLASQGCLFIVDKTAHASIQVNRGLLSQFGQVVTVDFKLLNELEFHFKEAHKNKKTPIAIADGVGSMGDAVCVSVLRELSEKYNGYIYLDDAHGTSIFGEHGCGYVLEKLNNNFHPRLILAASLSKGFGANGGVIAVPTKKDEEIIKRFSTTYVFGNPPPLSIIDAAIESARIHLSDEIYLLQNTLREKIKFFDLQMKDLLPDNVLVNYGTQLPIRGIFIGDEFKAIACMQELMSRGYLAMAAMYPTVAKNKSMIRVSLSANHQEKDITNFCNDLKEILSTHALPENNSQSVA